MTVLFLKLPSFAFWASGMAIVIREVFFKRSAGQTPKELSLSLSLSLSVGFPEGEPAGLV